MKILALIFTTFIMIAAQAQVSEQLDINNINATINFIDGAFHNGVTGNAGFEAPKGSGNTAIFSQGLWIGGQDVNGQIKFAAQGYVGQGRDFKPGCGGLDRVFKVDKDTIDYHINNYLSPGYTMPLQIYNWPAHGDPTCGLPFFLAPFADVDGNGIYEPWNGDYPKIKCDQAIWWYMRDDTTHALSGADPINMDLRCMAYACDCQQDSALANTVFIEYEIGNIGTQTIYDTWIGNRVDFDLGCSGDDYAGSHVEKGVFYAYNGDLADDAGCNGALPYGQPLPAVGSMVFGPKSDFDGLDNPGPSVGNGYYVDFATANANDGICYKGQGHYYDDGIIDNERLGLIKAGVTAVSGNPNSPIELYNVLSGHNVSGVPWEYGNSGFDAHMMYPDSSDSEFWNTQGNAVSPWTEETFLNAVGDRKCVGSSGPFTFAPGQTETITFAYIYGNNYTGTTNKSAIEVVLDRADYINGFIEQNLSCGQPVSIHETNIESEQFELYPNPVNNSLNLKFNKLPAKMEVYNQLGKLLIVKQPKSTIAMMDVSMLPAGIYFVKVVLENGQTTTQKFVKH